LLDLQPGGALRSERVDPCFQLFQAFVAEIARFCKRDLAGVT
jgi:hypothetical protein